ncbi:UPF0481 protein At3g47200-like [Rutidosis leptorrhynchoides]|uniref:UPF0481 protein At3g47200-like n=1 Tax=Rutidosis leptorrhynchoides TaxID=125765 RepID=UPI003A99632E
MAMIFFEHKEVDTVGETVQDLLDCVKRVQNYETTIPQPSIYMTPGVYRDLSPGVFDPQVVSIGPLHRGDPNLQIMEDQKPTYLHDLLQRIESSRKHTLNTCVTKVKDSVNTIRACYVGCAKLKDYNDAEVVKMIVMDACFILEFLYRITNPAIILPRDTLGSGYIPYDLMLFENQIPLFVLRDIFECTILKFDQTYSLTKLILSLLFYVGHLGSAVARTTFNNDDDVIVDTHTNSDHILGILHKYYYNTFATSSYPAEVMPSYSAVELAKAGVSFKPNHANGEKLAMRLFKPSWGKPVLYMPVLFLNESTNTVLYNLIAYEQCFPEVGDYVTQYIVAFMMLVNTQEDLHKLKEDNIVVYDVSGRYYDIDLIHTLCNRVTVGDNFSYNHQWQQINKYYDSRLGYITRTYFGEAWSYIASSFALIIFLLTLFQTYCSFRTL